MSINKGSGVLNGREMEKRLFVGEIHLPEEPKSLPGCPFDPLSIYLFGEKIFLLKTWFMRLHPGRILQEDQSVYSYRQSRPRRVFENTFGILVARWRIFNTPINASVEIVEKYVMAAVVLQNDLRQTEKQLIVRLVL